MKQTRLSQWDYDQLIIDRVHFANEIYFIDKANRRKRRALRQLTQAHERLNAFAYDLQNKFNVMTFERNLYKNDLMRSRERYKDLEKENKDLLFKLANVHSSLIRLEGDKQDLETINEELKDELKRQLEVSKLLAESNERLREELNDVQTDYAITLEQYTELQKGNEPYDHYADYQ